MPTPPSKELRIHELRTIVSRLKEVIPCESDATGDGNHVARFEEDVARLEAGLERYLGVFEGAIQGIFIATDQGVPVDCNQALASMLGYASPEDLLARVENFGEAHYVDAEQRVRNVARLKKLGELHNIEARLKHLDGSIIWTLVSMRLTRSGLVEGITINITPQKLAEEKLRRSEEIHRRILETAGEGFYFSDNQLTVMAVNEALCKMTGFTREQMVGRRIPEFLARELQEYLFYNREALLAREYRTFQGDFIGAGGERIPMLFNANTLRDSNGKSLGNAVFVTDLTEQKKAFRLAAEVQQSFFPKKSPSVRGVEVAGASLSSEEIGGDYFDYLDLTGDPAHAVSIVVGDVTGHGVDAALLVTSARTFLRSNVGTAGRLADHINLMNAYLIGDMEGTGHFMTLFAMTVEPRNKRVRWVRAGHDPAVVYSAADDSFEELMGPGMALGVSTAFRYTESVQSDLRPNTIIALGTDGIWEARDLRGDMYGKARLREMIRRNAALTAEGIQNAIFADLARFTTGVGLMDDATLVIVKLL